MFKRAFGEFSLPALGVGCMRLPTDENKNIDVGLVRQMVSYAMAGGVNYFDTGYDYHGGESERVIGEILSEYPRESFLLADKFPGYLPLSWRKKEKIFEEQLSRCGVDYFDFYLFHNVCEMNIDAYLSPRYGIFDYLAEQKARGRIKHLGFSVHGSTETTKRFLDAYGERMEFAQIQLNYVDYEFQKAREKLELLSEYSIPVFVMEGLRGGRLARLPEPFDRKLKSAIPDMPAHEAAFRFIQSFPEVHLTLSGMSDMSQLRENMEIFARARSLSATERQALLSLAEEMTAVGTVPCTACGYCTEHCPRALDIPRLISYYNEHTFSRGGFIVPSAIASMERDKRPTACLGCRECESLCPQGIRIADILAELSEKIK